jgi:hypothetical protein
VLRAFTMYLYMTMRFVGIGLCRLAQFRGEWAIRLPGRSYHVAMGKTALTFPEIRSQEFSCY